MNPLFICLPASLSAPVSRLVILLIRLFFAHLEIVYTDKRSQREMF
jgi:hypothetical protein